MTSELPTGSRKKGYLICRCFHRPNGPSYGYDAPPMLTTRRRILTTAVGSIRRAIVRIRRAALSLRRAVVCGRGPRLSFEAQIGIAAGAAQVGGDPLHELVAGLFLDG